MKKHRFCLSFLGFLCVIALLLTVSCKSTPPVDPDELPPEQELLDELQAAEDRAMNARVAVVHLQGTVYFPDEWDQGESDFIAANRKERDTVGEVNEAIELFTAAAEVFEAIVEKSSPLYARDLEAARLAMAAATAAAEESRNEALDNRGPVYFPDDWQAVETKRQRGEAIETDILMRVIIATHVLESATEDYDDITERSRPLYAQDREDANAALQAAMARSEQSRTGAQGVQANTLFPDEWREAEAELQAARDAPRDTLDETQAAATQYASAADMFDELAAQSAPIIARNNAQRDLEAAITRADRSRQAAMTAQGPANLANEWGTAENRLASAQNAPKETAEEIAAAAAQFTSAADMYDDIARRSAQIVTDRNNAQRGLETATARAERSRQAAMTAQGPANLANEWGTAESRLAAARNAPRNTAEQMNAAAAQFNSTADLYDDIARRSAQITTARTNAQRGLDTATARAERSRQAATTAQGQTHLPNEWGTAESRLAAARNAPSNTPEQMTAAAAQFNAAADLYDDIARRSAQITTAQNNAQRSLDTAIARADRSRQAAVTAQAQANMANEWRTAESSLASAQGAARSTPEEMTAAAAQFNAAADMYDDMARRSGQLVTARNNAQRGLDTAIARAERSRQAAMDAQGQTAMANEWRTAESRLSSARSAARNSPEEITAAAAQFNAAADMYDDIARRSGPITAQNNAQRDLDAAITRADRSRQAATTAQGPANLADEWGTAESRLASAQSAARDTPAQMNAAASQFNAAADMYDDIARRSGQMVTAQNNAQRDLNAAITRADRSRQAAVTAQGPANLADDWGTAESRLASAQSAARTTPEEMTAAAAQYSAAADLYDDIARRSGQIVTARTNAQRGLDTAIARADRSRQAAMTAQGQTNLPNDWRTAESSLASAQNAARNTPEQITAATAQFNATADLYDDIARRSGPITAQNNAQRDLDAAIARADRSRQAAMAAQGPDYMANEWNTAESRIAAARNAPRNTPAQMTTATNQFNSAADLYDDIARRSGPLVTRDSEESSRALQAAMTRAEQARRQAMDVGGQTHLPNDWRAAEAQNQTAQNARRTTPAEMRAAVPLFTAAADAYDAITRGSAEMAVQTARNNAERERQGAIDARAPTAVQDEFGRAEAVYQQALMDITARTFTSAIERFNESAPMFAAAARAARDKHNLAENAVDRARQRSEESIAFATNTGLAMEEINE